MSVCIMLYEIRWAVKSVVTQALHTETDSASRAFQRHKSSGKLPLQHSFLRMLEFLEPNYPFLSVFAMVYAGLNATQGEPDVYREFHQYLNCSTLLVHCSGSPIVHGTSNRSDQGAQSTD